MTYDAFNSGIAIPLFGSFPHVKIFYNKATNRVIGWVGYGL